MAYDDALFQLGMDLTRSSTAQEEDRGERAVAAQTEASDSAARKVVRTTGSHLVIDLIGARRLGDLKHVEGALKRCIEASGGSLLHVHLHYAAPHGGLSGVALLADGNAYFCSWPQAGHAQINFYSRGSIRPERALTAAAELFQAREAVIRTDRREKDAPGLRTYVPATQTRRSRPQEAHPSVVQPRVRAA